MKTIKLTQSQLLRAAQIYHPGSLYKATGWIEAERLVGGGIAIRYMNQEPKHTSTVVDYTAKEAQRILNS